MKFKLSNCTLTLNLDCGIYSLGKQSGTGKTYIFTLLKQISSAYKESRILVASYNDFTDSELLKRLSDNTYDIIMFDRYDLWSSEVLDYALYKHRDNAIIMVDVKDLNDVIFEVKDLLDIQISLGEVVVSRYVDTTFRRQVSC